MYRIVYKVSAPLVISLTYKMFTISEMRTKVCSLLLKYRDPYNLEAKSNGINIYFSLFPYTEFNHVIRAHFDVLRATSGRNNSNE